MGETQCTWIIFIEFSTHFLYYVSNLKIYITMKILE